MNYLTLGGGAIACSAIAVYGWAQTPQGIQSCPGQWVESVSSLLTEQTAQQVAKPCSSNRWVPTIAAAPDRIAPQSDNTRLTKLPNNVEKVYHQLLKQAHTAANNDRLAEAIASAASIPKNSQHYDMAQRLQEDWSQELLQRASNCYQQADLTMAMTMLNAIPQMSQRHERANELHDRWSQQATLLNQAVAAKEAGDWRGVMNTLKALEGTQLYQSTQVQTLLQQATNKAFASDTTLLQMASAKPSNSYATSLPTETGRLASLSIPSSQSSNLSIDINQALEWARPSAQSQLPLSPKAPKMGTSQPFADTAPVKSSIPVAR